MRGSFTPQENLGNSRTAFMYTICLCMIKIWGERIHNKCTWFIAAFYKWRRVTTLSRSCHISHNVTYHVGDSGLSSHVCSTCWHRSPYPYVPPYTYVAAHVSVELILHALAQTCVDIWHISITRQTSHHTLVTRSHHTSAQLVDIISHLISGHTVVFLKC